MPSAARPNEFLTWAHILSPGHIHNSEIEHRLLHNATIMLEITYDRYTEYMTKIGARVPNVLALLDAIWLCVWEGDAVRVVGASMAPAAALRGDRISDAEART